MPLGVSKSMRTSVANSTELIKSMVTACPLKTVISAPIEKLGAVLPPLSS